MRSGISNDIRFPSFLKTRISLAKLRVQPIGLINSLYLLGELGVGEPPDALIMLSPGLEF